MTTTTGRTNAESSTSGLPVENVSPGDTSTSTDDGARLNVNINARTATDLRRVARRAGISYTEAVRRAVEVLAFMVDEREKGHAIQVYEPERDRIREVVTL